MLEQKKMAPWEVRYPAYRNRTAVDWPEGWMVPFRNFRPISPINYWRMDDRHLILPQTAGFSVTPCFTSCLLRFSIPAR